MKAAGIVFLAASAVLAQTPPKNPAPARMSAGSVSGHFYDADTGAPLANFSARGPDTTVGTDDRGRYEIKNLSPGPQNIHISGWPDFITASVTVIAGEELTGVDFRFRREGSISGRITDQDKDPSPACAFARSPASTTEDRSTTSPRTAPLRMIAASMSFAASARPALCSIAASSLRRFPHGSDVALAALEKGAAAWPRLLSFHRRQ